MKASRFVVLTVTVSVTFPCAAKAGEIGMGPEDYFSIYEDLYKGPNVPANPNTGSGSYLVDTFVTVIGPADSENYKRYYMQVGSCGFSQATSDQITWAQWWGTTKPEDMGSCSVLSLNKDQTPPRAFQHWEACFEPGLFDVKSRMQPKDLAWWQVQLENRCKAFNGVPQDFTAGSTKIGTWNSAKPFTAKI